ncbi:MAG TPA: PilC/PilY family type IV pilus protein [Steroidobacteraceae bacterium]
MCWSTNAMAAAAPAPPVNISQIPLTVTIPAHPQILLALANSESMDGDLSGAIRTGSGSIPHPLLYPTSSPVNFAIPAGFTPPLNVGDGVNAPYTVVSGGLLVDNSPSRLNVAKAGLTAVLNAYIDSADFGLIDYAVGGLSSWKTWVYQMSNPGGFTFTNTIPPSGEYVLNPCYGVNLAAGFQVSNNCNALNTYYAAQNITAQQYMLVSASSDDPSVNDVFYDPGGFDPVCIVHGGPFPASPFAFPLTTFEAGGVTETYTSAVNTCPNQTGPTNAGFVGSSTEVMYEERGFGYYTFSETANDGQTPVPMTSSGAIPTAATVAAAIAHFTPYLAPETNSTGTQDIKASATQSPMAGLMVRAQTVFAGNPPTTNGCVTQRYVVLVTDGLPTMDLTHHNWPPLGSSAAAGYGVNATFNPDGSLASTNDQALTDVIAKLSALNSGANPIQTFIIGVGAGVDPTKNPAAAATLTAMSIAGGTGAYFPATSPQAVTDALQTIITHILAVTESTSSAAVNTTGLNVNSVVYQSQFVTSDTYQDWTGNVLAYPINPTNGFIDTLLADIHWSAQTQLDSEATRSIATWDPVAGHGIPFEWTPGTPGTGIAGSTALGTALQSYAPDSNGSDVVQYLRGVTSQEQRNGGTFRNRSHILGDIVDSNPAYIGPSAENLQSPSYRLFETATAHRTPVLYIGGNDGMLHAFDTTTGDEKFAYMPRGSYSNLVNLVSPFYNAQHKFFVNGSPQAADVQFSDLTWHSLLVGAEAQGGKSVFALDITDPTSMMAEPTLANKILWDIVDTDLGLGFSSPAIANTNSGWQVFVGNGYNSTNQKPFLYAIDPQHGTINAKIDLCAAVPTACDLTASNGLSGVVAVNTSGAITATANMLYAGDLQGNLWRVDISNSNPSLWAATVMFQARDGVLPVGNKQPITTKPVITLNPRFPQVLGTLVMFGTGQYLGVPDIANSKVQSVYGVYDPPAGYASPLNRSSLLPQTLANAMLGGLPVRTTSGTAPSYPANKGWYMDLSLASGERVINTPALFSGGELIFTTFQPVVPAAGVCSTLGNSWLMVLNYASGESFTTPQFDANGDGHIGSGDMVTVGGVTMGVAGVGLGSVYASGVTNLNGSVDGGSGLAIVTVTSLPNGGTSYVDPAAGGPPKARKAWWEIRQ